MPTGVTALSKPKGFPIFADCYPLVWACISCRTNSTWCRLSDDVSGWGCRLLTVAPTRIPKTEHEKGLLFTRVYMQAKKRGVLTCPHFNEANIDRIVEDTLALEEIIKHNS